MTEKKKRESIVLRIIIAVLFVVLILFIRNGLTAQRCIGSGVNQIVNTILEGAEYLDEAETDREKEVILDMMVHTLGDTSKATKELSYGTIGLKGYDLKEIWHYTVSIRGQKEDVDDVHEEIKKLANFIEDTGIIEVTENEKYNYFFDSRDVKQMIKDINEYCYLE